MSPAADTRESLMQAAAELMVEVGFKDMTTAAVAKRAGVAEGTIYRHFKSKEALAEAVFASAWDLVHRGMEEALPPRSRPAERLKAFGAVSMGVMGADQVRCALCNQEHLYYTTLKGDASALPPGAIRFVGLLEEAIRLAQEAGAARREVDPVIVANLLFHGAGPVMDRFVMAEPGGPPPAYTPEAFIAAFDTFLMPALFTPAFLESAR